MNYKKLSKIADAILSAKGKERAKSLYANYKKLFDKWASLGKSGDIIASDEGEGYASDGEQWYAYHGCNPMELAEFCVWRGDVKNATDIIEVAEYFTGKDIS